MSLIIVQRLVSMLITFSGLDGAGKTTLIRGLRQTLESHGHAVTVLTMYDHVGLYAFIRFIRDRSRNVIQRAVRQRAAINKAPDNSPGLGCRTGGHGKLMMALILGIMRSRTVKRFVYIFDLCIFPLYRIYFETVRNRILIIDRYFYDSLADIAHGGRRLDTRLFLSFTPAPNLPVFVDVNPDEAFARKGEYSVEYLNVRRADYRKIFGAVRQPIVLVNKDLTVASRALDAVVFERISGR